MADDVQPPQDLAPQQQQPAQQQRFLTPEILAAAEALYGSSDKQKMLEKQLALSQALRGGPQHHSTPGGAIFGGLADALDKTVKAKRESDLVKQMDELTTQKLRQQDTFNKLYTGVGSSPPPSASSTLSATPMRHTTMDGAPAAALAHPLNTAANVGEPPMPGSPAFEAAMGGAPAATQQPQPQGGGNADALIKALFSQQGQPSPMQPQGQAGLISPALQALISGGGA